MPSFLKQAPATLWIAILCTAAWLVTAVQSRSLSSSYYGSSLAQRWTLWGPEFSEHPLSVLSAGFMHLDAGHLVVNMVMLLFVGAEIERALGTALYTAAYVVSLLGASASILWMDYNTPTVGGCLRRALRAHGPLAGRVPQPGLKSARTDLLCLGQRGLYLSGQSRLPVGTPRRVVHRAHLAALPLCPAEVCALGRNCRGGGDRGCVAKPTSWALGITWACYPPKRLCEKISQ